jgi:hypothetical protein
MQAYIRVLRQRVRDSRHAVDEGAVAEAVLARAWPRLNAERANARKRLARLEQQITEFRVENRGAAAPARSVLSCDCTTREYTARHGSQAPA